MALHGAPACEFMYGTLLRRWMLLCHGNACTQASAFDQQDRVLVVVAHPDDETMFFSPLILSLTLFGVPPRVLCLSNGG